MMTRRSTKDTDGASGFTMIEMLITLTLFGLIMSSLVVGLRAGVSSWERIRSHQVKLATENQAFEQIRSDLERVSVISEDIVPVVESSEEDRGERLHITVLGSRASQRTGIGMSWASVEYFVSSSADSDSTSLRRSLTPYAGVSVIEGASIESNVLPDIASVSFEYLDKGEVVESWESEDALPSGVKIVLRDQSGREMWRLFPMPVGLIQSVVGS